MTGGSMHANIDWRTSQKTGRIRKLNGGNLGPKLAAEMAGGNFRHSYAEMDLAFARMHDAPLDNPNCRLVDISSIFPLFHLDANSPENYCFSHTDDYLRNTIEDGKTPVFYRLGESIDHTINKYFIAPPRDVEKWIDVCSNIIRHYTEGLWNGFHYDIRYWEIWNEPEIKGNKRLDPNAKNLMWLGTLEEFNAFFGTVVQKLKQRFPHLLFGGPAHCGFNNEITEAFLSHCEKKNVPLDFYSYHCYTGDPYGWIQQSPALVREALDRHGYSTTEIHLNEWHYFPGDWHRLRNDSTYKNYMYNVEMRGLNAAAFLCTVMALWQDTPLDYGAYYTVSNSPWGVYEQNSSTPLPAFYGMKAFGEIVRYPIRLSAVSDHPQVTVLAGQDEDGNAAMLVSAFNTQALDCQIQADKPLDREHCSLLLLDEDHLLSECKKLSFQDGKLRFRTQSNSTVALLKLKAMFSRRVGFPLGK